MHSMSILVLTAYYTSFIQPGYGVLFKHIYLPYYWPQVTEVLLFLPPGAKTFSVTTWMFSRNYYSFSFIKIN